MYLIDLYNDRAVNRIAEFAAVTEGLEISTLCQGYRELIQAAPRRHEWGKRHLQVRTGMTSSGSYSNRREEHLAVAIYNASQQDRPLALPDGRTLTILDYQTPLKARRDDRGIGKVDLFAAIGDELPCVVELKVSGSGSSLADTPLRAILEGFAYCALVEANGADIAGEVLGLFGLRFAATRPSLIVMAPDEYWIAYLRHPRAGRWYQAVRDLANRLGDAMEMEIHLVALRDADFEMGLDGTPARLTGLCRIEPVSALVQEA